MYSSNEVDRQHDNPLCFNILNAAHVCAINLRYSLPYDRFYFYFSIALWERKRSVIITLGILCLAHWALLYRTMFIVTAVWERSAKACVVTATNPSLLNVTFFFSKLPVPYILIFD